VAIALFLILIVLGADHVRPAFDDHRSLTRRRISSTMLQWQRRDLRR
jgi:hypothetical protein